MYGTMRLVLGWEDKIIRFKKRNNLQWILVWINKIPGTAYNQGLTQRRHNLLLTMGPKLKPSFSLKFLKKVSFMAMSTRIHLHVWKSGLIIHSSWQALLSHCDCDWLYYPVTMNADLQWNTLHVRFIAHITRLCTLETSVESIAYIAWIFFLHLTKRFCCTDIF